MSKSSALSRTFFSRVGTNIGTENTTAAMAVCKDMDSNNPFRGATALGNCASFGGRICICTITGGATGTDGATGSIVGRRTEKVALGFRTILTPELPVKEILSTTMLPIVKLFPPEPPANVRQLVLVPQVAPLPLWK